MREIRMSGLMSGDGKRDGLTASTRAHPRLYHRLLVRSASINLDLSIRGCGARLYGRAQLDGSFEYGSELMKRPTKPVAQYLQPLE